MYKITIKGEAKTDYKNLEELNGIDCQDEFSEYFDGDESYANVISSGYLEFKFENGKLWSVTKYNSDRELTKEELEQLADYTQNQWSDGIGEGFEQNPCFYDEEDNEVYISPWFSGQKLTIEQVKI